MLIQTKTKSAKHIRNMDDFQYTEQDLKNIAKYGCSGRFDVPFVIHLAKRCNVKNFDVNFTELYGVFSNETDFSGAIKRSLKNEKKRFIKFYKTFE